MSGGGALGFERSRSASGPVDVNAISPFGQPEIRGELAELIFGLITGLTPERSTGTDTRQLRATNQPFDLFSRTGLPGFSGPFAAEIAPGEAAALERLGSGPEARATDDLALRTIRGDFLDPATNPFLQATIEAAQRATREAFREEQRQNAFAFTQAGQRLPESSVFARERAISERGLANALGDISTRIGSANFQAERGRQLEVARDSFVRNIETMRANALPRLIADMGIQRGIAEFERRVNSILALIQQAIGATSVRPGQVSTSLAFGAQGSGQGGVGGGGTGGGGTTVT